jgi:hypothetical protein
MTDWNKLKVVDLKAELKRRGLPQGGLKQELISRLNEADAEKHVPEKEEEREKIEAGEPEPEPELVAEPPVDVALDAEQEPAGFTDDSKRALVPESDSEPVAPASQPQDGLAKDSTVVDHDVGSGQPATTPNNLPTTESNGTNGISTPAIECKLDTPTPAPSEVLQDSQKRKRRSVSPRPAADIGARKRPRAEDTDASNEPQPQQLEDVPIETSVPGDTQNKKPSSIELEQDDDVAMEIGGNIQQTTEKAAVEHNLAESVVMERPLGIASNATRDILAPPQQQDSESSRHGVEEDVMEIERDVAPALHPATSSLYIKNFMRPLRPNDVRTHLLNLAAPTRTPPNPDDVLEFYLDQIRSHAFVSFKSVSAASRVRTALHGCVWPDERNRKELWVDFIPPTKVRQWIEIEEAQGGGRGSSGRWEIVYEDDEDGSVVARLESVTARAPSGPVGPSHRRPQSPRSLHQSKDFIPIPVGPRALREAIPPVAPRGNQGGRQTQPRGVRGAVQSTQTRPVIQYQPVSEELAHKRLENMRALYTQDPNRDLGKEINRYYFENNDVFVDRGREVFEGIRPPHREREIQRQRTGGDSGSGFGRTRRRNGGRPPFRPRSDRYLPNSDGGALRGWDKGGCRPRYDHDKRRPSYHDVNRSHVKESRSNRDGHRGGNARWN